MGRAPVNGNTDSMKQTLVSVMHGAGAFAPFRMLNRSKPLILMYHRFSENVDGVSTSARCFNQQLYYLAEHYRIVPLSELARHLTSGQPVPPGLAVITIDDGYRDCYDIAYPILRARNIPATAFVVTDFIDQATWLWTDKVRYLTASASGTLLETTIEDQPLRIALDGQHSRLKGAERVNTQLKLISDEAKNDAICEISEQLGVTIPTSPPPQYLPLTWEQIRELDSSGVEIGSHTVTHPILTRISVDKLRYELRESRARLESELGHKVELLGYPNGDHNEAVQVEAARAGYTCAVAADYGLNNGRTNLLALKRIHTEQNIAQFAKSTSGFEQFKNLLIHFAGGAALVVDQSTNSWL